MNKYTKFFIITTKKDVKRQQRVLIDCQTDMNYVLSKTGCISMAFRSDKYS